MKNLPENAVAALNVVESYYSGIVKWLANMYDLESGGFYMSVSGMRDPEMKPAVEMTWWGVDILKNYTNAFDNMPPCFREGIINFLNERQDSETGMFIDKQGPANPRETARNQDSALKALAALNASTKYTHPREAGTASNRTPVMPEYMASPESYLEWIKSWNWDDHSWTAGDQSQSSLQYVNILEPDEREKYKAVLFDFLEKRQFESGFWSPNFDFNAVSGAFKVGLVYDMCERRLPNHDKIIDTVFECYKVSKTINPCFIRNPISLFGQMSKYDKATKEKIQKGLIENIELVVASFGEFLCPDGAFSSKKCRSMYSFGGVVGSHELNEGDIDATKMMLIARRTLYSLLDLEAPILDATDFWDWIYGRKPMPKID